MSDSYSILDVPASPVYGLLETVSGFPWIEDTGFADWLESAPVFSGARNFRDQEPGWALGTDVLASFIPYVGWGTVLNRAATAGRIGGILGATNRAGGVAASAFKGNVPLAFAAGETVRYAPVSAAITGLDVLGGRYTDPWDALLGFGVGTALGAGFQAAGTLAAPAITRWGAGSLAQARVADPSVVQTIPYLIGESWKAVFEPGPQLSALYGFSSNQRAAAARMAAYPPVQEAMAPGQEPQMTAREIEALRREAIAGQHPDVDVAVLDEQYDRALRSIVEQRPYRGQSVFGFEGSDKPRVRTAIDDSLRFESDGVNENIVRVPLTGVGDVANNPDVLARALDLPESWLPEMKWPGVTYVARSGADEYAKQFNFIEGAAGRNFRRVLRTDVNVKNKVWVARRDPEDGLWFVSTRIPGDHRMGARAKVEKFSDLDPREEAHAYFTFKTDRPGRFFPDAFADTDNANPESFWFDKTKIPKIRQGQVDLVVRRATKPGRDVPRNPFPADKIEIAYPRSGAPVGAQVATTTGAVTSGANTFNVRANLDMVLDDGAGNQWVVRKDIFDKTYKKLKSGKFQKRDDVPVGFFEADQDGVVQTLEGPQAVSKGDRVLIGPLGEMWPQGAERFAARYNIPMKSLLDVVMDFHDIYLSPRTIKEIYGAWDPKRREAFIRSLLTSPGVGEQLVKGIEKYAAPTIQQLKNSPEGRAILGMTQSTFEAAEDRARLVLYGHAQLGPKQSPMGALFGGAEITNASAIVPQLRRLLQEDPSALEQIRRFLAGQIEAASLSGTPAGQWIDLAIQQNLLFVRDGNLAIGALTEVGANGSYRPIPILADHIGLSRKWDGDVLYPIYREGAVQPEAKIAGNSQTQALKKAEEWIAAANAADAAKGKKPANFRKGSPYVPNETDEVPAWVKNSELSPGLLDPRTNMRGFEHEFNPYKHVDEFVAELEENYITRARYFGAAISDALTTGRLHQLRVNDPHSYSIVNTRITQIKGIPGPIEQRINQIVDSVAAPLVGTRSITKAADAANQTMFHLLHGAGNIITPLLNLTAWMQTLLPEMVAWKTSSIPQLKEAGFHFPNLDGNGVARSGFSWVPDMSGLMWGGIREALDPSDTTREVFKVLPQRRELAGSLANEYLGQDNEMRRRVSEGIRGPEDFVYWLDRTSSFLMQKSEQMTRTIAATTMLKAMDQFEAATGKTFTMQQRIDNAANMVTRANYAYFKQDRPMMYSSPGGAIFGNQKTWMTNYLFMMMHYSGLAAKGNFAPLAFSLGTTVMLGGAFAIPFLGQGIDALTETFADRDGREFIFEKMRQGGNAISFGIPALFGMSLHGNVSAPGSNLAHDAEFFFSIVALERAKLLGRAIGTAWDDQMTLGMNPLKDEIFRRQAAQALAPRAIYRAYEALMSDQLTSAATGYPMVKELGWGSRVMTGLGFRPTEIAIQYEAYRSLLADKAEMRRQISAYGEAYAVASIEGDRAEMTRLLQRAAVMGLDQSSIMQSAHIRMRNYGRDMFGRNFSGEQLEEYQESLRAGGVR